MEGDSDDDFAPSALGTKEHWDSQYDTELQNFEDSGDIGEIWFGEGVQRRMIEWMRKSPLLSTNSCVVDIGSGNGALLSEMAKKGFSRLVGLDYSAQATQLAQKVADADQLKVTFHTADIVTMDGVPLSPGSVNVCVDKGTYDAISLNPDDSQGMRDKYVRNVFSLLREKGLLVITSCNWTKAELLDHFSKGFEMVDVIPNPSLSFGGKSGSTVTSLVFQRT